MQLDVLERMPLMISRENPMGRKVCYSKEGKRRKRTGHLAQKEKTSLAAFARERGVGTEGKGTRIHPFL